ncbi:hypothetical protein HanPI659440_Chr16g0651601 [Helianthus annuus]|nr:hypothetical protein HanPI659440_Chr16g0651601 [Helianthus annuus]
MMVQDREVVAEIGVSVGIHYSNLEIITSSEKVHQHNNLLLNRNCGGGPRIMAALVRSPVVERVAGRPLWSQASGRVSATCDSDS